MKTNWYFTPLAAALSLSAVSAPALFSADSGMRIGASFNEVSIGETSGRQTIQTGSESRTELESEGGTIRIGSNSRVEVRDEAGVLDLREGVMMVKTGRKGILGRESLTVETEQIRADARATMLISYQPRRYIKIACLDGKVTVTLKGIAGETVTIRRGQLLIINCLENLLPSAVSVDMNRLMQTSPLLAPVLRGGPARNPVGDGAQRAGTGSGESQRRNANEPPPPESGQQQAQNQGRRQPPPPNRGAGNGAGNQGNRPRPNDLPGRRIDCNRNANAPECRPAPRPPGGGGGGGGGNPPPPPPPPPPGP